MATAAAPPLDTHAHEHQHAPNASGTRTVCVHCVAKMYADLRLKEVETPLHKGSDIKACLMFDLGLDDDDSDGGKEEGTLTHEHVWVRVRGDPARGEGSLKNMPVLLEMCNGNRAEIRKTRAEFNLPTYGSLVRWRDAKKTPHMRVLTAWRTHPTDQWHAINTGNE